MQKSFRNTTKIFTTDHHTEELNNLALQLLNDNRRLFILCDDNSYFNCLHLLYHSHPVYKTIPVIRVHAGEKHKTIYTAEHICHELLMHRADKRSVLINMGGGMITDIGGFVAGIFKRGIDCIHVPTTLLAVTDAALGGKSAVNIAGFKNQAGAFIQPLMVFNFLPFLKTLPQRHINNGWTEMIKHGLIASHNYFNELVKAQDFTTKSLIEGSILIKQNIADADPLEKSHRKLLNFGHTIGHAVESFFQDKRVDILHGEAIAAGIICESLISVEYLQLSEEDNRKIHHTITSRINLTPFKFSTADIMDYMLADKKNSNGAINFSLLKNIGEGVYDCYPELSVIEKSVHRYLNS